MENAKELLKDSVYYNDVLSNLNKYAGKGGVPVSLYYEGYYVLKKLWQTGECADLVPLLDEVLSSVKLSKSSRKRFNKFKNTDYKTATKIEYHYANPVKEYLLVGRAISIFMTFVLFLISTKIQSTLVLTLLMISGIYQIRLCLDIAYITLPIVRLFDLGLFVSEKAKDVANMEVTGFSEVTVADACKRNLIWLDELLKSDYRNDALSIRRDLDSLRNKESETKAYINRLVDIEFLYEDYKWG